MNLAPGVKSLGGKCSEGKVKCSITSGKRAKGWQKEDRGRRGWEEERYVSSEKTGFHFRLIFKLCCSRNQVF